MAFVDRVVDYPNRFTLTDTNNNVTGPYTLTRDEGLVTTEGTLLNAANLNEQTQVDSDVVTALTTAGMTSGTYQNDMSDALYYLLQKVEGISTGTSNGWTYLKLTTSLFIAARQVTPTLALTTAQGSLYTTSADYDLGLPSFTSSVLFIAGEANSNRWVTMTNVGTSPKWRPYSPVQYASGTVTVDFFMVGTY